MSFFRDPELFLTHETTQMKLMKIFTKFGEPFKYGAVASIGEVMFSVHLSSGDNKMSDFDLFFGYLSRNPDKYVNCQGLVIKCAYNGPERKNVTHTWSAEKLDLSLFGLPAAPINPCASNEKDLAAKMDACNDDERIREKQVLEERVRELEAVNATLVEEIKRVEDEKNALVKTLDVEKAERLVLQETISSLEAMNSTLQGKIESATKEKNDLVKDLYQEKAKRLIQEKLISDLKAENSTLESQVESAKNEKVALVKELEEEKVEGLVQEKIIHDLKAENATLEGEIGSIRNEKTALTEELEKQKAQVLVQEKTISELKSANATLEGAVERIANEKDALTQDSAIISGLKAENSALEGEVEKVKIEMDALVKNLEDEKANGLTLEKSVSELKDEIAALKDKNRELSEDLDRWTHEISTVHNKLSRKKKLDVESNPEKFVAEF